MLKDANYDASIRQERITCNSGACFAMREETLIGDAFVRCSPLLPRSGDGICEGMCGDVATAGDKGGALESLRACSAGDADCVAPPMRRDVPLLLPLQRNALPKLAHLFVTPEIQVLPRLRRELVLVRHGEKKERCLILQDLCFSQIRRC